MWNEARRRGAAHGHEPPDDVLCAVAGEKKLGHLYRRELRRVYDIATSRAPLSCREHSLGTPTGLHRVCARHGEGTPLGSIFKGRVATGQTLMDLPPGAPVEPAVTTRILRLEGLEPGHNQGPGIDSHDRFIYVHGLADDRWAGTGATHGCLGLRNLEMIALFAAVPVGAWVYIAP